MNSRVYRITARTFELTDRYTKAITQLGDDKLDVRLGGVYALEQLATDSENVRDQATIVEVLGAFVRVHSDPLDQYKSSLPKESITGTRLTATSKAADYVAELGRPPVDVQAAVTVLGRLPLRPGIQRADLFEATLTKARLRKADLTEADLVEADLTGANLHGADLTRADLRGANLTKAQLRGADLTRADLRGANLTKAQLRGANLTGARLIEADLTEARLIEADLTKADLFTADLTKADLGGANLGTVKGLAQDQLDDAIGDSNTTLPAGLRRPESWSQSEGL